MTDPYLAVHGKSLHVAYGGNDTDTGSLRVLSVIIIFVLAGVVFCSGYIGSPSQQEPPRGGGWE